MIASISELSSRWRPDAIILVVEHRHCICGQLYVAPNPNLQLRLCNTYTGATMLADLTYPYDAVAGLARETLDITEPASACPSCFTAEPGQHSLFPLPIPQRRQAPLPLRRKPPVSRTITLDDFM